MFLYQLWVIFVKENCGKAKHYYLISFNIKINFMNFF